jgi:hypothetical protein
VESLPCNERIAITWSIRPAGKLAAVNAIATEAGCL